MTASLDRVAYEDCYDLFDRALTTERGVRMKFHDFGQAMNYRLRMNRARSLDRDLNRRIHSDEPDHPEYGRSKYSVFTIRIRFDDDRKHWWLLVSRNVLNERLVEDIPDEDDFVEEIEAVTGLDLTSVEEIDNEREGAS